MQLLQRIWQDIRQGENIDLYITVVVSIALSVLNVAGIASQFWIAPLNLGILALLAFAILGNRHRLEAILQRMTGTEGLLVINFPDDMHSNLEKSRELLVLGVSLMHTLRLSYALFEEKLRRGDIIKTLLVNPDSPACEVAAMRSYQPTDVETQRAYIRASLGALCDLQEKTSGRLEIRVLDNPLAYGGLIVDPNTSRGIMYLWYYRFKTRVVNRPKLVLRPTDGYWYESYKEEVTSLWNNAVPWQVQNDTTVRN